MLDLSFLFCSSFFDGLPFFLGAGGGVGERRGGDGGGGGGRAGRAGWAVLATLCDVHPSRPITLAGSLAAGSSSSESSWAR